MNTKLLALAAAFIFASSSAHAAVLVSYNFNGTFAPTGGTLAGSATPFTAFGGQLQNTDPNRLRLEEGINDSTPPFDPNLSRYSEITLSALPGDVLDLSQLSFGVRRQSAGRDGRLVIRSSADAFAADLYSQFITDENSTVDQFINLGGFINLPSYSFRLYVVDQNNSGLTRRVEVEDLSIEGTTLTIPEPSSLLVLGGLALCFAARRRAAKKTA